MSDDTKPNQSVTVVAPSWQETLRACLSIKVLRLVLLGFSAGLPILLIFSSLSLWLREAGIDRAAITFFSWAALGYSFKFVWAPLVDQLRLPYLSRFLGQRRGWLLLAQLSVISAICIMAMVDPATGEDTLFWMAIGAVLLGFSSATQDIVIDAYRIEVADERLQGVLAAAYTAGYRFAMIIAGAGALVMASHWGSSLGSYNYEAWRLTYFLMAGFMLVGVLTTLSMPEPEVVRDRTGQIATRDSVQFLGLFIVCLTAFVSCFVFSADFVETVKRWIEVLLNNAALSSFLVEAVRIGLACAVAYMVARLLIGFRLVPQSMVEKTYLAPIKDFFARYGVSLAVLTLCLVGTYRISDIILGIISNVFYLDMGYSKTQIASAVKTFGVFMVILGGFLGGLLTIKFGVLRILLLGALLSALTNLLFVGLALSEPSEVGLYLVVAADNLSAGLASAAFIAFLSSLTNVSFTAMQYAIFSSLMTLLPKALGGYSGSMVDAVGYPTFFVITALLGLPVIVLIVVMWNRFDVNK